MDKNSKKTVCIDLDGVLAKYDGWKGATVIGDPIKGAREFVDVLAQNYSITIHTTRANTEEGREAIEHWLKINDFQFDDIAGKPAAVAYVDDRAVSCQPQKFSNEWGLCCLEVYKLGKD